MSLKLIDNVVTTLAPSFLIVSSSFLQATWTPIKSGLGSKFIQIRPRTVGLAALDHVEKIHHPMNIVVIIVAP